jgi:hypothetical protein
MLRHVIGKVAAFSVRRQLAAFEAATHRPREVQDQLLRRILTFHAGTDFGRLTSAASSLLLVTSVSSPIWSGSGAETSTPCWPTAASICSP